MKKNLQILNWNLNSTEITQVYILELHFWNIQLQYINFPYLFD